MAAGIGPFIHKDNLVFGIDNGFGYADNGISTRTYAGEPTTNLLPNPNVNGRFSSGNGWGTYNTNRYNGAQYFSIGSISSVSNNIITTAGSHTLRSFDVLRPQTTGGGVSAGTDYVVKKISDTQFSLHAYNGSQDGSQGYTNPDTQFFKVHDAYATDTRISVNSTSFPTMWWGAPHLPNSGLIKETINGGGKVPGTNCLRWHIYRGDGVADGMAYGVDTPVSQGNTITVSFWIRAATPTAAYKGGSYTTWFGGNAAFGAGFTCGAYGEWVHVVYQWTASVNYSFIQYWFPQGSGDIWSMDISDIQVEVNRGHATPFVAGTRSATQSLKDIAKTTTPDVSNVSFDADNLITFDGSNDYIDIGNLGNIGGSYSIEVVFKSTSVVNYRNIVDMNYNTYPGATGNVGPRLEQNSNGAMNWVWSGNTSNNNLYNYDANVSISANSKYHSVFVLDNGSVTTYLNGAQVTTASSAQGYPQGFGDVNIGRGFTLSPRYFAGDIYVVRIYKEALTSTDVQKNFRAYKERFDI